MIRSLIVWIKSVSVAFFVSFVGISGTIDGPTTKDRSNMENWADMAVAVERSRKKKIRKIRKRKFEDY